MGQSYAYSLLFKYNNLNEIIILLYFIMYSSDLKIRAIRLYFEFNSFRKVAILLIFKKINQQFIDGLIIYHPLKNL